MPTLKQFLFPIVQKVLEEELDIPSPDGTSNTASEDDKKKAADATAKGQSVKFVKPGEIQESEGMIESYADDDTEIPEKIVDTYGALEKAAEDIADVQDFADKTNDVKMKKVSGKLALQLKECIKLIHELKQLKEAIIAEENEKASQFGDKVIKTLGKHIKDESTGQNLKGKYMKYIAAAFKKGKSPKEVAERIHQHRFEI